MRRLRRRQIRAREEGELCRSGNWEDGEKKETRRPVRGGLPGGQRLLRGLLLYREDKGHTIYAAEEDGAIQAMLHLNPYTLLVNGKEEPAHYIVAVATREAYRKRGYMAALLKRALADMHRAGEPFTFLMPAAEAIYLPHGFATVYEQEQRFYDEAALRKGGARAGLCRRMRRPLPAPRRRRSGSGSACLPGGIRPTMSA